MVNNVANIKHPCNKRYVPQLYIFNTKSLAKPHAGSLLLNDLNAYDIDIAIISETHFNQSHDNFHIDDYCIVRKNRPKRCGGGITIIANYSQKSIQNGHYPKY